MKTEIHQLFCGGNQSRLESDTSPDRRQSNLMKKQNPIHGSSIMLFTIQSYSRIIPGIFIFFILFSSCKKEDLHKQLRQLPSVVSTNPNDNAVNVPLDRNITVVLSSNVNDIRPSVSLSLNDGNTEVFAPSAYVADSVIFSFQNDLKASTNYTATISYQGEDVNGRMMSKQYSWHFTTKGPDQFEMTKRSDHVTDFLRDGTRSMQIGNYLYSFGGWHMPDESFNDVYRSTDDLTQWEKRADAPWHGRHVYGIAQMNGYTYVMGGDNLQMDFDVWRTQDGETWTQLADHILSDRIYYGCCAHNGYLYVVGGSGFSDVWRSADGIQWTKVADNISFLNGENFAGSLISYNGRMYMVCGGGTGGGTGIARKTVWSSVDGVDWQQEADFGGTGRYYTDLAVWDNKLWVVGGYNVVESNVRSIWYMKRDGSWSELELPSDYIGRHATGVAVYNNKLAITCGSYNNDCWVIEKVN
jgi:hypothetical protein